MPWTPAPWSITAGTFSPTPPPRWRCSSFSRSWRKNPYLPAGADEIRRVERIRENRTHYALVCQVRRPGQRTVRRTYFLVKGLEDQELLSTSWSAGRAGKTTWMPQKPEALFHSAQRPGLRRFCPPVRPEPPGCGPAGPRTSTSPAWGCGPSPPCASWSICNPPKPGRIKPNLSPPYRQTRQNAPQSQYRSAARFCFSMTC